MKTLIRKCNYCNVYTMEETCQKCGNKTVMAIPMKYSPTDKFKKYRLRLIGDDKNGKNNY